MNVVLRYLAMFIIGLGLGFGGTHVVFSYQPPLISDLKIEKDLPITKVPITSKIVNTNTSGAEEIINDWPEEPKKIAIELMSRFGQPDESTSEYLLWNNVGNWKRIIVTKEKVPTVNKDPIL